MRLALNPFAFTRAQLALCHAGLVVIAASWLLGGIGPKLEWIVALLASPSLALLIAEGRSRFHSGDLPGFRRLLRWSTPLALLVLLVVISSLNPSHRPAFLYNTYVLRPIPHIEWLPSTALPSSSLRILACFGSLACVGLTLAFCVHTGRHLRALMLVLCLNTLALAVLGSLQHKTGAAGPYFGSWVTPNPKWFATFLYHNHWGAFAILSTAASLGLVFRSLQRTSPHPWLSGSGPLLTLCAAIIVASIPLSSSRSCTVLIALLVTIAIAGAFNHILRFPRKTGLDPQRGLLATTALLTSLFLLVSLITWQSRDILSARIDQTLRQLDPDLSLRSDATLYEKAETYGRTTLYADTWNLAAARPVFGWGLDTFGLIFLGRNSMSSELKKQNVFEDAHSDWLQALAEIGFLGTFLLLLFALLPLLETLRRSLINPLSGWLLGGCTLIAAYAWLEFPFANPAVVALWWVSWFTALRCLQLGSNDRLLRSANACSPSSS